MLEGTFTALVTPFDNSNSVDFGKLCDLVEWQIEKGISGLVPVGTTGESPTLSMEEHCQVVDTVIKVVDGRVKVIAGSGANSTSEAIYLTKFAKDAGADATLQVTPYYNKPSQEGLYRHFSKIAELELPVVLYNVPGRTSREISAETVARLSKNPLIVAIKEASGDADRVSQIRALCDMPILSGDDSMTLPMISVGACGVISVAANVMPFEVSEMVREALAGNFRVAAVMHRRLYPLFRDLFIDTNPVPVKAALARMGRIAEIYRLPLCEISDQLRSQLNATMDSLSLP